MTDPKWLACAYRDAGLREVKGRVHNPRILAAAKRAERYLGIRVLDDETAWCGTIMADWMLTGAGIKPPMIAVRARSWASWGVDASKTATPTRPPLGAVAVFGRVGGGHVGIVDGVYSNGDLRIWGGNQSDGVNHRRFARNRKEGPLLALRWPSGVPFGPPAPWVDDAGVVSTGEA